MPSGPTPPPILFGVPPTLLILVGGPSIPQLVPPSPLTHCPNNCPHHIPATNPSSGANTYLLLIFQLGTNYCPWQAATLVREALAWGGGVPANIPPRVPPLGLYITPWITLCIPQTTLSSE